MYEVPVTTTGAANSSISNTYYEWPTYYSPTSTFTYSWPSTIYLYQIICPKPRCKTANWLEIDKMKECSKCGSLLKAVSAKADYEIEVGG